MYIYITISVLIFFLSFFFSFLTTNKRKYIDITIYTCRFHHFTGRAICVHRNVLLPEMLFVCLSVYHWCCVTTLSPKGKEDMPAANYGIVTGIPSAYQRSCRALHFRWKTILKKVQKKNEDEAKRSGGSARDSKLEKLVIKYSGRSLQQDEILQANPLIVLYRTRSNNVDVM